jgi:hypothetical protein
VPKPIYIPSQRGPEGPLFHVGVNGMDAIQAIRVEDLQKLDFFELATDH